MERSKRIFGLNVYDIIDNIVDHNSIVAIWEDDKDDPHFANRIWKGEGWKIPDDIGLRKFKRIFSSIPETVLEGDVVNIEVYLQDKKSNN